jgi:hypothetical protein
MVEMLAAVRAAAERAPAGAYQELGWGLSGGEMPHAQACVLYALRTGVVEQLGEPAQRLLLDRRARCLPWKRIAARMRVSEHDCAGGGGLSECIPRNACQGFADSRQAGPPGHVADVC